MASRIYEYPDENGNRCFEMHKPSSEWHNKVARWHRDSTHNMAIEPIIAKGNSFDGVDAWY